MVPHQEPIDLTLNLVRRMDTSKACYFSIPGTGKTQLPAEPKNSLVALPLLIGGVLVLCRAVCFEYSVRSITASLGERLRLVSAL